MNNGQNTMIALSNLHQSVSTENLDGMEKALILLSQTKLATSTTSTTSTYSTSSTTTPTTTATTLQAFTMIKTINLPFNDYSTIVLKCIGPYQIHTDMVRLLLLPYEVQAKETVPIMAIPVVNGDYNYDIGDDGDVDNKNHHKLIINIQTTRKLKVFENHYCGAYSSPLIKACQYQNYDLVRLLLEHDGTQLSNPNVCGADGLTPLIRMCKIGDLQMVQLLLKEKKEDDDNENHNSSRTDHKNNNEDHTTTATTTIQATTNNTKTNATMNRWGTNIYLYDQQSMNALIHACTENHEDIVRYLLEYSIRCSNSPNNNKSKISNSMGTLYVNDYKVDPPIWYACAHGNASIVRLLLDEYHANITYRTEVPPNNQSMHTLVYSSTPFMEACEWGHLKVITILLDRGDDIDLQSSQGIKGRELARSAGYHAVVGVIDKWIRKLQHIQQFNSITTTTTTTKNNDTLSCRPDEDEEDNDHENNDCGISRNNNEENNNSNHTGNNNNSDDDDDNDSDNNVEINDHYKNDNDNDNATHYTDAPPQTTTGTSQNNNNSSSTSSNDNNNTNTNTNTNLIPRLLPIVISMTANRYNLTYQIISRHQEVIISNRN